MRRWLPAVLAIACLAYAASPAEAQHLRENWNNFWNRVHTDFHRNNAWPEPFLSADRAVVRETFGIQQVVARIYDPGRAEVYQRLGITTVATVKWTADQVLRRLLPAGAEPDFRDMSGNIRIDQVVMPESWVGERTIKFQRQSGARIAWIDRLGEGIIPVRESVIQEGDVLHVVMREENTAQAYQTIKNGPEED